MESQMQWFNIFESKLKFNWIECPVIMVNYIPRFLILFISCNVFKDLWGGPKKKTLKKGFGIKFGWSS